MLDNIHDPKHFVNRTKGQQPEALSYTTLDGKTVAISAAPRRLWLMFIYISISIFIILFTLTFVNIILHKYNKPIRHERLDLKGPCFAIFFFASLAWGFIIQARRAYSRPIDRYLESDGRPPVLYLRSFSDDTNKPSETTGFASLGIDLHITQEMKLCKYLRKSGPVVAIGKPGEHIPQLGAARLYVHNDFWKTVASDLMNRACLVILKAGNTPGLQWEYCELFKTQKYDKIIIWLPFKHGFWKSSRNAAYSRFRDWVEPCLQRSFPESIGNSSFMFIDPDGHPKLLDNIDELDLIYHNHSMVYLLTWMEQSGFLDVGKPWVPMNRPKSIKTKTNFGKKN